ncbi:serine hydrolase [Rhodococcus oxybenzonivorans]|uniref:serine hydrolase domain-containing protein n=1 Tax=Rhodococcus oxybenzonivorans TaxID=1990687 RepID=UPI002952B5EE|nr:serine hydrolase [Rhodococcus oxybenzonivorans]MDV7356406.1 serine hydrolase [Rhodococcus oxybenzonivorans]
MTDQTSTLAELGLFTGAPQHDNFCRLGSLLPTRELTPSSTPHQWRTGDTIDLPDTYEFAGETKSFEDFFVETDTAALLVLEDGVIRHERYALTGGPEVPWISMSVAKSFVSALVGIAVAEGHIKSIDDPISDYVPVHPGSAYDGVSIRNVLQMSSGARWNEDYSDPTSDVFQLNAAMAGVGTLDDFVAGVIRENEPGTLCRYNSGDTQALASLVVRATNRSLTDYMQEKLYEPLGMTSPGAWLLDAAGMEVAFAGLNMTARDFAKLGELYRNGGEWHGNQVVPEQWVRDSVVPDAPYLQPGQPIVGTHRFEFGYGYQWWIPAGDHGEFSAIGVYNQFVYVDPTANATVVKLSSNRTYGTTDSESTNHDHETGAFIRAVINALRN